MTFTPERPVRVLYVGGLPRSGSTLSDLILHGLPGHVAVGELFYLFRNGLVLDNVCGCGEPFSVCDFWQSVGEHAFGGWSRVDAEHVLRMQARVDRTVAVPAVLSPWRTPSFRRALAEYQDLLLRLYDAIRTVSGAEVVVDSSKRPSLAYLLHRTPGFDVSCVHVVRDPRGVAYSFGKVVPLTPSTDAGTQMPRSRTYKVARRWITVNAMVRALHRLGVPSVTVRYEDLAADPARELVRVAELQGVPAADIESELLTPAGLRVTRAHLVAGSRIRFLDGVMPIRLDEEWRSALPVARRRLVSAMTVVSRARYGYTS
jgi:hypothetical protein